MNKKSAGPSKRNRPCAGGAGPTGLSQAGPDKIRPATTRFGKAGFGLLLLTFSACAGAPVKESPSIFWPKPPDPPRISFVQSWDQPDDIGIEVPWYKKLVQFVFGKGKTPYIIRPSGVTTDTEGGVYVADTGLQVVHYFDTRKHAYSQLFNIDPAQSLRLQNPIGVAVDAALQVYVSDADLNRVFVFDREGKLLRVIGNDEEINRVSGIAVDPQRERLYVVDTMGHQVLVYSLQGEKQGTIGKRGVEAGTFNFPTYATVDGAGRLYVSDSLNFRIQIFDPEGKPESQFGSLGSRLGEFSRPKGIAVDRENNVYVVDTLFDTVQVFNEKGELLLNFGATGTTAGHFWLPSGIAVDGGGRIYVADGYNKRVQVFQRIEDGPPKG